MDEESLRELRCGRGKATGREVSWVRCTVPVVVRTLMTAGGHREAHEPILGTEFPEVEAGGNQPQTYSWLRWRLAQ